MKELQQRLGYEFRSPPLLEEALTHPSVRHEKKWPQRDNQRLEYLGDAVLQLVVTEYLFHQFPVSEEGLLTKLRARLVSREALRTRGEALDLGQHIRMGKGEEANGGRARASTLADAFEALAGAIFLDGGIDHARAFILREMKSTLDEVMQKPVDVNPKGQLQETLQCLSPRAPSYEVKSASGPAHARSFVVEVSWEGHVLGLGDGNSKQAAEISAATDALAARLWLQLARPAPRDD
ncbi:MAG: ribonuclease III [Verrucomicrobiota bacterium]|nr:ribonuclease III [Verrucomicrobiota bacterium]